jgi:hypothetical protein
MMPFAPQMTRFTPNVMMPFTPGMARFTPNGVMSLTPAMTGFTSNGMMQPTSGMMRFTPNGMMPFTTGMGSPGFGRQPFRTEFEGTNRHFDQIFSPLGLDQRMFFQTGFNSPMFSGF